MADYLGFADESGDGSDRFRSLCLVTLPAASVDSVRRRVADRIQATGREEFKWAKLKTARAREEGNAIIDAVMESIVEDLAVHVIIWDTHDRRHRVKGRDDGANRERMFFHLAHAALRRRPPGSWELYPDSGGSTNWDTIKRCLDAKGSWPSVLDLPLLRERVAEQLYQIRLIQSVDSRSEPLVQVADLFAGLGAYSRTMSADFMTWHRWTQGQGSLFEQVQEPIMSNREQHRFPVIDRLAQLSRRARLGVSLRSKGYLLTHDPDRAMSFWHYTPQHELDRAPVRGEAGGR